MPLSATKNRLQVCSRRDLLAFGYTKHRLNRLVADGHLRRLGSHWFGTDLTPFAVASALRRNHRLTCVSALEIYGVFVPLSPWPHEVGRQCSCRAGGEVLEHPTLRRWPDDEPLVPLRLALDHAVACLDAEGAAIVLESALNQRLISEDEAGELVGHVSLRKQRAIGRLDRRSMSGTETRVRRFLERLGVQVVPRFEVAGVGVVDMLVGDRLVLECDSREHHTGRQNYANDRRRDQRLAALGYLVVRLTYEDVMVGWLPTQGLLRGLVAAKVHRGRRRGGGAA